MKKIGKSLFYFCCFLLTKELCLAQQAIGIFSQMDGGFEGQGIGNLSSSASSSSPNATQWVRGGASGGGNGTINTTGARTGDQYLSVVNTYVTSNTSPRTYISPYTSINPIVPSTSYVIQFFAKATDGVNFPNTNIQVGVSCATGTASRYTSFLPTGNPAVFTKYVVIDSSNTAASANGFSSIKISSNTLNTGNSLDLDDWVVYPGNTADTTAPADPGLANTVNPLSNSLDVNWSASSDVDGGGYLVIRYTSVPGNELAPNPNGIYKVGNVIGNGVVAYVGTLTEFTDVSLTTNTNYYYRIYSVDKAFNYSVNFSATSGSTNSIVATTKYYIDSVAGADTNPGTIASPWKNISKLNSKTLTPGTQIFLKCGSSWTGQQLKFNGSGTAGSPIVIDQYGTGAMPLLAGNGLVGEGVVYLYNQQYIEINHLEITNDPNGPNDGDFFVGFYQNGTNTL